MCLLVAFLQRRPAAKTWHNWIWRISARLPFPLYWWKIWSIGNVSCNKFWKTYLLFSSTFVTTNKHHLQPGQCLYCCSWKSLHLVWGNSKHPQRCTKVLCLLLSFLAQYRMDDMLGACALPALNPPPKKKSQKKEEEKKEKEDSLLVYANFFFPLVFPSECWRWYVPHARLELLTYMSKSKPLATYYSTKWS